ncbi:thiolase family protein [Engelhardtia mirabilis]|uniref:Acetyl-CoA acetyltransferase n=1 Tax=Engelhardtia mirabilis TaxID=2528011 RepID=A0A518BHU7_9BACT|nr:Acetyl-CoA acetyltransferase [Planctomycetes bacterium Pla133]QDV00875.1 Acetyl-CoA acetyltransferase [Planctomycetes bacterium Pla86]
MTSNPSPTAGARSAASPVVITHALRTPIGKYLGAFAELSAADLGSGLVAELLQRSKVEPGEVGELIFGNGRQAGGGPNVARQISVRAGLPVEVPALTINMACASGLKSIALGADWIRLGRASAVVVGGVECMSGLPFFLPKMRTGYRLGHAKVVDAMYQDGFDCPLAEMVMGATAEGLAQELEISRDEQDQFALDSQRKAAAAVEAGRFADEIVPVAVPQRRGDPLVVAADEHPRPSTSLESLAKLPAVFAKEHGTVTAGNASGITDGAAALMLMTAERAEQLGHTPLAYVGECAEAGVDPRRMGIGPVPAMRQLAERCGRRPGDYDLIELNEAFAAQVLACHRQEPLPLDRLNVNGGSIALGHPIGATGARIVVTMLHELARRGGSHGLATLCVSGGMGLAAEFHREGL